LRSGADVLVFSAHPSLLSGSGVSGVIHKAAGKELEQAVKVFAPIKPGQAIITPAFNLSAKYVIHAVCPRYIYGTDNEEELLARAYSSALALYDKADNANSIAFVSMGTGVYRWPLEKAAKIAVGELSESKFKETIVCVVDEETKDIYQRAYESCSKTLDT
jgi:O-acetyl-ADP-ribose deacetylase (regulator of RNase III)